MQPTSGSSGVIRRRRRVGIRSIPSAGVRLALVAVLVGAALSGCVLWPSAAPAENDESPPEDVYVVVHNYNFYDVTIYAHRNGDRRRLGRVTGNSMEEFRLAYRIGATVRFEVRLQAGGTFHTDSLVLWPGEEVVVEIPPHLDRVRVRR